MIVPFEEWGSSWVDGEGKYSAASLKMQTEPVYSLTETKSGERGRVQIVDVEQAGVIPARRDSTR